MITEGIKGNSEKTVQPSDTALRHGSGSVEVFATPAMIAMMENCADKSLKPFLPEGSITVGIKINATHNKATPVGEKVFCNSEVTEVEGRKIVFKITCCDEHGIIGEAHHERFIVNKEKFMAKLQKA